MDELLECKYCNVKFKKSEIDQHIDSSSHTINVAKNATPEELQVVYVAREIRRILKALVNNNSHD